MATIHSFNNAEHYSTRTNMAPTGFKDAKAYPYQLVTRDSMATIHSIINAKPDSTRKSMGTSGIEPVKAYAYG